MGRIIQPDDLKSRLDKIESDVRALQTAPSLGNSSIKDGALTIFDAAGTPRVILGKDPADSVYGFKLKDSGGGLIADGVGLAAVMSQVGGTIQGPIQTINSATPILVTNSSGSFVVARTAKFGIWFSAECQYFGTGMAYGLVELFIDGVSNTFVNCLGLYFPGPAMNALTLSGLAAPISLAAGTHTFELRASQAGNLGTSTFIVIGFQTTAFRWGA